MDPNAALTLLLESLAEGDRDGAAISLENLRDWIDKGGFLPELSIAGITADTTLFAVRKQSS